MRYPFNAIVFYYIVILNQFDSKVIWGTHALLLL